MHAPSRGTSWRRRLRDGRRTRANPRQRGLCQPPSPLLARLTTARCATTIMYNALLASTTMYPRPAETYKQNAKDCFHARSARVSKSPTGFTARSWQNTLQSWILLADAKCNYAVKRAPPPAMGRARDTTRPPACFCSHAAMPRAFLPKIPGSIMGETRPSITSSGARDTAA